MKNNNLNTHRNKAGRPKNSPNKVSSTAKEIIKDVLEAELAELQARMNDLKPNERIKVTLELLQYIMPKLKAIEITEDNTNRGFTPIQIEFTKWQ
jgi:hypothetical protein